MTDGLIKIRAYEPSDRGSVRRIACETAFLGEPRELIFDDDEILADALTLYFTDYEPESCFVAVTEGKVIGYIIGTTNVESMNRVVNLKINPRLILKSFGRGVFFKKKSLKFLLACLKSYLKGELFMPDFSKEFPATLHINIESNFRGQDLGSKLIMHYLGYLKENKISGVHFGTISEGAKIFFSKLGFRILWNKERTYFRPYMARDIEFYIFGKRL